MSSEQSIAEPTGATTEHTAMEGVAPEKGKGKAIQENTEEEDDSSDDDFDMVEEPIEESEEDELAGIDTSNIIHGTRTRRKNIDWTAVKNNDAMDDSDEDDDEYKAPEDEDESMRE